MKAPDYKYIGCRNGWLRMIDGKPTEVPPVEYSKCREKNHKLEGYSTMQGYHETWCDTCKIKWDMDSGD